MRIPELTGLRFVAAFAVLIAHAHASSFDPRTDQIGIVGAGARLAYFGMSLFFVLSGFVIQTNYGHIFNSINLRRACWQFFVARLSRLYPLYALTLVLSLQRDAGPFFSDRPGAFIDYLTLTQSWFNMQSLIFQPDWSVSTEWFFYLMFVPLALAVPDRMKRPEIALGLVLATAPALLAFVLHNREWLDANVKPLFWHDEKVSADFWGWVTYFSPYTRSPEFISGVLAGKVVQTYGQKRHRNAVAELTTWCCAAWCLSIIIFANLTKGDIKVLTPNFVFAPAIALFLVAAARYQTTTGRFLSCPSVVFLGEISYSIYMWSWFAIFLTQGHQGYSVLGFSLSILLTVAFAAGSYQLIERPAQTWLRRKLS
ncbi:MULTISPECIES: acyltransferase [unclassified Bradyrhizobium]|uniref:acyltransferase family protein n=1 Tax=unclassified Bradyrhizobium TaxID=2631580 RepID=UPI002916FEE5|nr:MULTISPECIES: acyltransferase [unclassified Bradyrhizobium]